MSINQFPKCATTNESSIPVPKRISTGMVKKSRRCSQLPELQKYIETIIKASNEYDSEDASLSDKDKFPKERKFAKYSVYKGVDGKAKQERAKGSQLNVSRSKTYIKAKTPVSEAVSRGVRVCNMFVPEFEDPRNWKPGKNQNSSPSVQVENFLKKFYPNPYHLENLNEFNQTKKDEDELRDGTLPDVVISKANIHTEVDIEKRDNDIEAADTEPSKRESPNVTLTLDTENSQEDAGNNEIHSVPVVAKKSSRMTNVNSTSNTSSRASSLESITESVCRKGSQMAVKKRKTVKTKSRHKLAKSENVSDYDIGKLQLLHLTDSEKSLKSNKTNPPRDENDTKPCEDIFQSDDLNDMKEIYDIMYKATESFLYLSSKTESNTTNAMMSQTFKRESNNMIELYNSTESKLKLNSPSKTESKIDTATAVDENKVTEKEKPNTTEKSLLDVLLQEDKFEYRLNPDDRNLEQVFDQADTVQTAPIEVSLMDINDVKKELERTNGKKHDEVLNFMYTCMKKFNNKETTPPAEGKKTLPEDGNPIGKSLSCKRLQKGSTTDVTHEKPTTSGSPKQSETSWSEKQGSTEDHFMKNFPDIREIQSKYSAALSEINRKAPRGRCRKRLSQTFTGHDSVSHHQLTTVTPAVENPITQPASYQHLVDQILENGTDTTVQTVESQNELGSYTEANNGAILAPEDTRTPKMVCPLSVKRKKSKTSTCKTLKDVLEAEEKLLSAENSGKETNDKNEKKDEEEGKEGIKLEDDEERKESKKQPDDGKIREDKKPAEDGERKKDKKQGESGERKEDKKQADGGERKEDKKPAEDGERRKDKKQVENGERKEDKKQTDGGERKEDKKQADDRDRKESKKQVDDRERREGKKRADDRERREDKKQGEAGKTKELTARITDGHVQGLNEGVKLSQLGDFKRPSSNFVICVNNFPRNLRSLTAISPVLPVPFTVSVGDLKKNWKVKQLTLLPKLKQLKKLVLPLETTHRTFKYEYIIEQVTLLSLNKTVVAHTAQQVCLKMVSNFSKQEESSLENSTCLVRTLMKSVEQSVQVDNSEKTAAPNPTLSQSETTADDDKPVKALIEAIEETEEKVLLLEQSSAENLYRSHSEMCSLDVSNTLKKGSSELEMSDRKKINELLVRTYNLQQKLQQYLQKINSPQPTPAPCSTLQDERILDFNAENKTKTELEVKPESPLPVVHWHLNPPDAEEVLSKADESVTVNVSMMDHGTSYDPPAEEEKIEKTEQNVTKHPKEGDEPLLQETGNDEDDRSSNYSFKSSNDFSESSEARNTKKESKRSVYLSNTKFFQKIYKEIESFRRSFEADKLEKQQQAESTPVQQEEQVDRRVTQYDPKTPAKVLRTVFTGKKSSTELTIGLKDVPMTKVGNISVEKTKFSPNHTKISVAFTKEVTEEQPNKLSYYFDHVRPSVSTCLTEYSELKDDESSKTICEESDRENDEEDDYKSVGSRLGDSDTEDEKMSEPKDPKKADAAIPKNYTKHRFDFYQKMDTDFDSNKLRPKSVSNSVCRYKELEPLKEALTEMQIRMRNIKRDAVFSSNDYYERALKLAKMSAGFCQSCGNRAVIPNDTFGYYRTLLPRRSTHQRRSRHFRPTIGSNPSFYSLHSSNAEVGDQFCDLGIKHSSYMLNSRLHSNRTILRSSLHDMPILFERF